MSRESRLVGEETGILDTSELPDMHESPPSARARGSGVLCLATMGEHAADVVECPCGVTPGQTDTAACGACQ